MKLLHTSDWHLGKTLHEHSLLEDQRRVLMDVVQIMEKDPHDAMIVAGDIYDRSIPPAEAVTLLSNFLKKLRDTTDMPVFIIPGNHDSSARLSYLSEIITMAHIHIRTGTERVDEPVTLETESGMVNFFLIPFLSIAAYDVHREEEKRSERSHEHAVQEAVERIRPNIDETQLNILAAHLFTRGGKTSDSERRFVGAAGEVDASVLDGFDYVALGHLHRPQNPAPRMHYSGSLLKYSFSEVNDAKRLLSVNIEKGKCEVKPLYLKPPFDMARIRGDVESLMSGAEYAKYEDHYIEVELTERYPLNPLRELQKRFRNILSIRMVSEKRSGDGIIPGAAESVNIEDDFEQFHRYIHRNKPPNATKVKLFQEALKLEELEL
jgi:exonuclease SbcD